MLIEHDIIEQKGTQFSVIGKGELSFHTYPCLKNEAKSLVPSVFTFK